jgi:hypothetical protein
LRGEPRRFLILAQLGLSIINFVALIPANRARLSNLDSYQIPGRIGCENLCLVTIASRDLVTLAKLHFNSLVVNESLGGFDTPPLD